MTDELARIGERVRQNRMARQMDTDRDRRVRERAMPLRGGTVVAGDRVFDVTTGQEGDVVSQTGFGGAPLGQVDVRLDGGATVTRRLSDLVLRPRLPAAEG